MSASASSTSRPANSPASGGGFDRPQVAITIGLEWRLPPARAVIVPSLSRRQTTAVNAEVRPTSGRGCPQAGSRMLKLASLEQSGLP
jgi:hypothetical protein